MIVYLLLNQINLKGYVGQHKGNKLSTRWDPKFNLSKVNDHLRKAVKKYGYDVFSREILNHCSTPEEMDSLEKLWILVLRTYDSRYGYNKAFGGMYCRGHTPDARKRISEAMKRVWANRSREKQAEAIRKWWRTRTVVERQEIRQKMSEKRSGQKLNKVAPPWNKGRVGLPSPKKGKKYGPQKNPCQSWPPKSEETRRRMSESRKRYLDNKRFAPKKPVVGAQDHPQEIYRANRK